MGVGNSCWLPIAIGMAVGGFGVRVKCGVSLVLGTGWRENNFFQRSVCAGCLNGEGTVFRIPSFF